mgnify:CR=1 FL=1
MLPALCATEHHYLFSSRKFRNQDEHHPQNSAGGAPTLGIVSEQATSSDLGQHMKRALKHRIDEEIERISVNVEGVTVTLTDRSLWPDHDDIEDVLWTARR